jgi:hypothetical protein
LLASLLLKSDFYILFTVQLSSLNHSSFGHLLTS